MLEKSLRIIEQTYRKAPYFQEVFSLIRTCCIGNSNKNLFEFLLNSLIKVKDYLGITTEILISSELNIDHALKGEQKIYEICNFLGIQNYVNAIGGQALYDKAAFKEQNLKLFFLQSMDIIYSQNNDCFKPALSIIDVMMFNSRNKISEFLNSYKLI